MNAKQILKKMIPMVLAGASLIVLALPINASAHDWCHHDNGRHLGWYQNRGNWGHRDWDDDHCDFRPRYQGYNYGYNNYRTYPPVYYGGGYPTYGYGGGRQGYLMEQWQAVKARHDRAVAMGNRSAAEATSDRLYNIDRRLGYDPRTGYGNGYGYQSYGSGPVVAPLLGSLLGGW
jgi:hypothetical protein